MESGKEKHRVTCDHTEFVIHNTVKLLSDTEGGPVTCTIVQLTVACALCGTMFEFVGAPFGLNRDHPSSSHNFKVLNVPIIPAVVKTEQKTKTNKKLN